MKFEYRHGSRLDYAAFTAVALSQVITHQSDMVGAVLFDREVRARVPASNRDDVMAEIARAVQESRPKDPSALGRMFSLLAEELGRRRVVFILSDFFGELEPTLDGLKRLMDDRHEIVLLHLLDPIELRFDLMGRVRLLELEGPGKLDITGAAVRESYEREFQAFLGEFRSRVQALGLDYIACDTSRPFGFHLAEYLSGRVFRRYR